MRGLLLSPALLVGLAFPAPALSQFGTPTMGIEQTGSCRTVTVPDLVSRTDVSIGCLDTTKRRFLATGQAQVDGTYYIRRNGTRKAFDGPLMDGPTDDQVYGRSGRSWAAIAPGGSGSVTNSAVLAALGSAPVNQTGDTLSREMKLPRAAAASPVGCSTLDGHFTGDGLSTWVPTCYGTWSASDPMQNKVNPTRGTASSNGDYSASNSSNYVNHMITHNLVQMKGDGNLAYEQSAFVANMDAIGGSISQAANDPITPSGQGVNVVGFQALGQIRPSPIGQLPPTMWGFNFDISVAPGSGQVQAYGVEGDLSNFDRDCSPGVCNRAWYYYGGVNPYPNLAFHYVSNPATSNWIGTLTASGSTFSRGVIKHGPTSNLSPLITIITFNGSTFRVECNGTTCTADRPIGSFASPICFKAWSSMAHFGMFFQDNLVTGGGTQVKDTDFLMGDAARTIVQAIGHHRVGLDLTGDDLTRAALFKSDQSVCYTAGEQNCFKWDRAAGVFSYAPTADGTRAWWLKSDGGTTSLGGFQARGDINGAAFDASLSSVAALNLRSGQVISWPNIQMFATTGYGFALRRASDSSVLLAINESGGLTINGVVAASCAAGTVNPSTMVVTNGLVTHC